MREQPPADPAAAEALAFHWSCSFGYSGENDYRTIYRHADGRRVEFHWRRPSDPAPVARWVEAAA